MNAKTLRTRRSLAELLDDDESDVFCMGNMPRFRHYAVGSPEADAARDAYNARQRSLLVWKRVAQWTCWMPFAGLFASMMFVPVDAVKPMLLLAMLLTGVMAWPMMKADLDMAMCCETDDILSIFDKA